jgi:hypothetical protein
MKTLVLALPIIATLLFTSCEPHTEPTVQTTEDADSTDVTADSVALVEEDRAVAYNLPSALQIASVFKKSGATFIPSLTNIKSNVSKYTTSNYKKAVNFGIYSADLAYCLSNKQYQESKDYLKASKDMGAFLGLDKAFESDRMPERFDRNISNEDSLIKIVAGIQMHTDVMFEENKQKHIKLLALVGAWTESLYIAGEVYSKDKNKKVRNNFMEQLMFSKTIVKALNGYMAAETEIPALVASIEKINNSFNQIPSIAKAMEQDENTDFNSITVSDAELKPLLDAVKTLRTEMVN